MYYIINTKTNKVLTLNNDKNVIWSEDMYHPLYVDTRYDAFIIIRLIIQFISDLKEDDLEIRKIVHD